jgi:hypothetical protein
VPVELGDERLNKRYWKLVKAHMNHTQANAAGPAPPVEAASSFAATQATWRFLANERVTPQELVKPLREFAKKQLHESDVANVCESNVADVCDATATETSGENFVLLVSDWCKLKYTHHAAKKDVLAVSHEQDIGYDLTTHLLVDARNGQPVAPLEMHLRTADKVHTTRDEPVADVPHIDQILPTMEAAKAWDLPAKIVHVIDREADSVWHMRQWHAAGHVFLVRADDRHVTWPEMPASLRDDQSTTFAEIVEALELRQAFRRTIDVEIRGRKGYQEITETTVVLDQPARHKVDGRKQTIPGEPLALRLVIARIRDIKTHELLGTWHLLTNVDASAVSAERIALWYHWRWKIESYFKLMKSAGMELDHWQQESGRAILNRLLVASPAAAIWSLQRATSDEAKRRSSKICRPNSAAKR